MKRLLVELFWGAIWLGSWVAAKARYLWHKLTDVPPVED